MLESLFEVNISMNLPGVIAIETPIGPWTQSIEYEQRPKFYNYFLRLGHKDID